MWIKKLISDVQQFLNESGERERSSFLPSHTAKHTIGRETAHGFSDRDRSETRKKAFISYTDEDEDIAINLLKYLELSDCPCWISFRDVDPDDDYRVSITRAMDKISFLVLIYSESVNTSFDIATELILARKRLKRRFVLKTDSSEPAGPVEYELATVQWIDCQSNQQAAFDRIAQRAKML